MAAFDFAVIGGGMAGASVASELAARGRVVLLERETQPGFHSTGRSAAMLIVNYGPPEVVALTKLGEPFFRDPPAGFAEHPLVAPCGCLVIGETGEDDALDRAAAEAAANGRPLERLPPQALTRVAPRLRTDGLAGGLWDPTAASIDVHGLLSGFLRVLRRRGGEVRLGAEALGFEPIGRGWRLHTGGEAVEAQVVVNAAGAWADAVGAAMGARPKRLVPHRRTAALCAPGAGADVSAMPMVLHVGEQFYFKPEGDKLLVSPADETPSEPCDAAPEELDVAIAVDRMERVLDAPIRRVTHRWAGLRTFTPDRRLVVGFDPDAAGLFWLAGHGGAGIQSSPGLARFAAALAAGEALATEFAEAGLSAAALSPARCASLDTG